MNLHEFQAKELLAQYGVPIPRGRIAGSVEEAERVARRLGPGPFVVKAQVHAGDRAASGGVRLAADPAEVGRIAGELIGRPLVTAQTGPGGQHVRWVYVEDAVTIAQSLYCAVLADLSRGELLLLAGEHRGAAADNGQAKSRDKLARTRLLLTPDGIAGEFEQTARATGIDASLVPLLAQRLSQLADAAVALDATLIEISPFAVTGNGDLVALDAKMTVDDNALFRHPDVAALSEVGETEGGDPTELAAQRHQINYLRLDGNIGVIVNGAGLALATLDVLAEAGGKPANFMDVRTTASSLDVAYGLELIAANPRVRVILVNVHGGGMQRCDTIAEGIGIAMRKRRASMPLVVRLAGNNAEFARTRLQSYGLAFVEAADMWEAANAAVDIATRKAA